MAICSSHVFWPFRLPCLRVLVGLFPPRTGDTPGIISDGLHYVACMILSRSLNFGQIWVTRGKEELDRGNLAAASEVRIAEAWRYL